MPESKRVSYLEYSKGGWNFGAILKEGGGLPFEPAEFDRSLACRSAAALEQIAEELGMLTTLLAGTCGHARETKLIMAQLLEVIDPEAAAGRKVRQARMRKDRLRAESMERTTKVYGRATCDPVTFDQWVRGLTVRARKAMRREGVSSWAEVCGRTAEDWLCVRNFGPTSLAEVRAALKAAGWTLKGDDGG